MSRVSFVLQWTIATAAATVAAELTLGILGSAVLGYPLIYTLPLVGGLFFGVPIGVAQWAVLRRRVNGAAIWIAATVAGFAVTWVIAFVFAALMQSLETRWGVFIAFAIATPLLSLPQARLLRRWTSRAPVWIPASIAGWIAFLGVLEIRPKPLPMVSSAGAKLVSVFAGYATTAETGAMLLGGLIAGAITGAAMAWILESSPDATAD